MSDPSRRRRKPLPRIISSSVPCRYWDWSTVCVHSMIAVTHLTGCHRGFQTTSRANLLAQKILKAEIAQGLNSSVTRYTGDNCKIFYSVFTWNWWKMTLVSDTDARWFWLQRPAPPLCYQRPPRPHLTAIYGSGSFDSAQSLADKLGRMHYAHLQTWHCQILLRLISSTSWFICVRILFRLAACLVM
jgi:hypothetical protein